MSQSNYYWSIEDGVLCIVDVGPHSLYQTVTNDAENVLEEIRKELYARKDNIADWEKRGKTVKDNFPKIIIYKDSDDIWDGLQYRGELVEFYPIRTKDRGQAVRIANQRFINLKR